MQVQDGMQVTCGGIITNVKKIMKSGTMAILTIEDIYGTFDVMLFSKLYGKFKDIAVEDKIRDGKSPVVVAENIIPREKAEEKEVEVKKVYLRFDTKNIDVYNSVKKITASYPGQASIIIKCLSSKQVFSFNAKVDINNYLINELIGLLGEENVVIK